MTYLLLFAFLFFAEIAYFKIAAYYRIIDKPNERSSHIRLAIRGGGIIFYVAVLAYFILSKFSYPYFFMGLTLVTFVSFIDDIQNLGYRIRILTQLIATLLLFYQLQVFHEPLFLIITLLFLTICTLNAFNFMDGINGITGGYSLVTLITLWYINQYVLAFVEKDIILYPILALIVFNFFNFRQNARCFPGDVGSISIAFIIVFLFIKLFLAHPHISVLLPLSLYGVDSGLTIVGRLLKKENIIKPHRLHLFQLLVHKGKYSHLFVTTLYMFIQLFINLLFIFFFNKSAFAQTILTFSILGTLSAIYIYLKLKYRKIN